MASVCDPIVNIRHPTGHLNIHGDIEKIPPSSGERVFNADTEFTTIAGPNIHTKYTKSFMIGSHRENGFKEDITPSSNIIPTTPTSTTSKKSSKKRSHSSSSGRGGEQKSTTTNTASPAKKRSHKSKSSSKVASEPVFVPNSTYNHNNNNHKGMVADLMFQHQKNGSDDHLIFAHYMNSIYDSSKLRDSSLDCSMECSNDPHAMLGANNSSLNNSSNGDQSLFPSFCSSERDYIGFATSHDGSIHHDNHNHSSKEEPYLPRLFSDAFSSYERSNSVISTQTIHNTNVDNQINNTNTHMSDNFGKAADGTCIAEHQHLVSVKTDTHHYVLDHTESHVQSLLIDSPRTSCNNLPFHNTNHHHNNNTVVHPPHSPVAATAAAAIGDNTATIHTPSSFHCEIHEDPHMMIAARPQTSTLADIDASAMSAYTKLLCDDGAPCGDASGEDELMAIGVMKDRGLSSMMKHDDNNHPHAVQRASIGAKIARCLYYDDDGSYGHKVNPITSALQRPMIGSHESALPRSMGAVDELYMLEQRQ